MVPGMQVLFARLDFPAQSNANFTSSICGIFTIAIGVGYNLTRIFI